MENIVAEYKNKSGEPITIIFAVIVGLSFIGFQISMGCGVPSAFSSGGKLPANWPDGLLVVTVCSMLIASIARLVYLNRKGRFFRSLSSVQLHELLNSGQVKGEDGQLIVEALNNIKCRSKQ